MSDPAAEAAKRAWAAEFPLGPSWESNSLGGTAFFSHAAREALAPIRELHRVTTLAEPASPLCDSNDHDVYESAGGEMVCVECTNVGPPMRVCRHCWELSGDMYVSEWPCATTKLVYTTEELER